MPKSITVTTVRHDGDQSQADRVTPHEATTTYWEGDDAGNYDTMSKRRYPHVDQRGRGELIVQAETVGQAWQTFRAEAGRRGIPYWDNVGN